MEIIEDNLHPKVLKNRLFINAIDYLIEKKIVEVVHVGGDNMVNAIHNNASFNQIGLKNVTYIHSSGKTYRTNETRFEQPVDGVEYSKGGTLLYQDDREYLQNITINVNYEGVNNTYNLHSAMPGYAGIFSNKPCNRGNGENDIVFNDSFLTNLYGGVYVTLPKEDLIVGDYTWPNGFAPDATIDKKDKVN